MTKRWKRRLGCLAEKYGEGESRNMIREKGRCFELSTKNTTYAFRARANGLLEHLYYGARIDLLGGEGCINFEVQDGTAETGNTGEY